MIRVAHIALKVATPLFWVALGMAAVAGVSKFGLLEGSPPIELVGTPQTEITADGRWRITRTIRINEVCGSIIWDRSFKGSGDLDIRRMPAAGASEGMGLDPIQGARPTAQRRPPGTYTSFWLYDIVPGQWGSYNVRVSPGWCPSGWSKSYDLYSVPYDWRDVTPQDQK